MNEAFEMPQGDFLNQFSCVCSIAVRENSCINYQAIGILNRGNQISQILQKLTDYNYDINYLLTTKI